MSVNLLVSVKERVIVLRWCVVEMCFFVCGCGVVNMMVFF